MKVYLLYLKSTNKLYAQTSDKEIKDRFLAERNKNCFNVKKVKLSKEEYKEFKLKNSLYELTEFPISTSLDSYVNILGTTKENVGIDIKMDELAGIVDNIYKRLVLQSDIKSKYIESIEYLCTLSYLKKNKDGTKDLISKANTFKIFYELYKNTFVEDLQEEDI